MHEIPELDKKGLRDFGLLMAGVLAVLFGLLLPWLFGFKYPVWPWIAGAVFLVWALAAPGSLRLVYRGWMRFGLLISKVMTPLIISIIFFLIISPMALIIRLLGRDTMSRRLLETAQSYRILSKSPTKESMEKPF